ncbi:MAG: hypothetical protein HY925_10985 [Elusimicrobia bacterium]|nr:hypothetical protein [Elusimicrobiota bacterium]
MEPNYMAMGETGMDDMMDMGMAGPENTLPMMGGEGPFEMIGMGGMFTTLKVHDDMPSFATQEEFAKRIHEPNDGGWYRNPPGTVAESVTGKRPKGAPHEVGDMKEEEGGKPQGETPKKGMDHSGMKMDEKAKPQEKDPAPQEPIKAAPEGKTLYRCPMGHVVHQAQPGECPVCGMKLKAETPEEQAEKE